MADVELRLIERLEATKRPLDSGGGGSDNGGMDHRIDKLEEFAEATKERLVRMETILDHVEREVSQTKWWIIGQIVALFVAVVGTGVAIQQMTVATFQGGAQVAKDASPPQPPVPPAPPIIINVPGQQPSRAPAK